MQQEEAASSYAGHDDLESPPRLVEDLVASLVHVNRKGKLPLLTTTRTTTSVPTDSAPSQQLQVLTQHQYVVPHANQQHLLQVSQIAASPSTHVSITSSIDNSSHDSPALDNARLTEPFSPVYPLLDSESEGRSPTSIDQCKPSSQRTLGFLTHGLIKLTSWALCGYNHQPATTYPNLAEVARSPSIAVNTN
jgi:hypothetical protein